MAYFTSRNLVILALAQVGVLVAAILGASVVHKWHTNFRAFHAEPELCGILMDFGWLGLILPVSWLSLTLKVFLNQKVSDGLKTCAVSAGLLLLGTFLVVAWYGAASPVWQIWNH